MTDWIIDTEVEYNKFKGRIAFIDPLYITIALYPTGVRLLVYPKDQHKVIITNPQPNQL